MCEIFHQKKKKKKSGKQNSSKCNSLQNCLTVTNILTLKVKHFGFPCRYAISFQAINVYGTKSEFGIDNFSMSPQCFGLGVPKEAIDNWRINMTDTELCKYYGKLFFNSLFSSNRSMLAFSKAFAKKNRYFHCQKLTQLLLGSAGGAAFALQLVELRHNFETEFN